MKQVLVYLILVVVVYFIGRKTFHVRHFSSLTLAVTIGLVYLLHNAELERQLDNGQHGEFLLMGISGIIIAIYFLCAIINDREDSTRDISLANLCQSGTRLL